jgi:poly(3-hydroxybutyrate) depolymerase
VMVESYDAKLDVSLDKVDNSGDIWGGLKNPAVKSAGCGKPTTIKTGAGSLMSGGVQRPYVVDIPTDYDPNKPYRFFFNSHGQGSTTANYVKDKYYAQKSEADAAKEPAIHFGAQGYGGQASASGQAWGEKDHALFDDVVTYFKNNMCIDETRIFTIGMSMGGMQTYSLSTTHAKKIRAGVGIAPTNINIWLPATHSTDPEAWMQTTGMSDNTCKWIADEAKKTGSKFIALEKAANNGCTIPAEIPTWKSGAHVCYDFQGCKPGYPVKVCTFNGGHQNTASDPGSSVNWIGAESWKFFTQF